MSTFLVALHVIACLVLILVVLLQRGKGADMGAALGGGASNTVFGGRGAGNFLTKLTSGCAVIFMMTSLSLAYLGSEDTNARVFDSDEQANPPSEAGLLEDVEGLTPASTLTQKAGLGLTPTTAHQAPDGETPTASSSIQSRLTALQEKKKRRGLKTSKSEHKLT